jgi:predicted DNA binding protein
LFEVFLRFQHDCPYNDLSRKYPESRISMWCNGTADILEIEADSLESFDGLQRDVFTLSKDLGTRILSKTIQGGKLQLVAKTCACSKIPTSTSPVFEKYNFMEVPPDVMSGGWEHYRLIGFDEHDLPGMLKRLDQFGKAEVLYKSKIPEGVTDDSFLISLSSLFGQLTEKQLKALVAAVEAGYYEIPKKITTGDLARQHRQPRTTFEEHIRKAESKIVHAMTPFMMMYAKVPGSPFVSGAHAAAAPTGYRVMKQITASQPRQRSSS